MKTCTATKNQTSTLARTNKKKQLDTIPKTAYQEVVGVWDSSVRATHHFLKVVEIK